MSERTTAAWLRERGYDGLYQPEGPCGCGVEDFAPCGEGPFKGCVPAKVDESGFFWPTKRGLCWKQEQAS